MLTLTDAGIRFGVHWNLSEEPTYDPATDYESPYDLEAAKKRLAHMESVSPVFKLFMDGLRARSTARTSKEDSQ